jgi:hypothetical protein
MVRDAFSTAAVDAFWASLWKTAVRTFAVNDLARRDEIFARMRTKCRRAVFHSDCGCALGKPVDKPSSRLWRQ